MIGVSSAGGGGGGMFIQKHRHQDSFDEPSKLEFDLSLYIKVRFVNLSRTLKVSVVAGACASGSFELQAPCSVSKSSMRSTPTANWLSWAVCSLCGTPLN